MRRILVALDRSTDASYILDRAVQLARETGAKLRLLRAVPLPPLAPPFAESERLDGRSAMIASAEASLRKLEARVPEGMRDGFVIELGSAAAAICRDAEICEADLVVIGAHRGGALRRALGTTANKVVNATERPVLLVRAPQSAMDRAAAEAYAVRFSDHDKHPLLETATLAGAAGGAVAGVFEVMRRDHELLDELYGDLLVSYAAGDWPDVAAQWIIFEPALRMHMDAEERDVLPAFRGVDPVEADALLGEHAALRTRLGTLGMLLELHAVPERDAEELVLLLRAHSAHEASLLYPWMDEAVALDSIHGVSSAA